MKKQEKKLLVRAAIALVLTFVFAVVVMYLEARAGIVKEELLIEHLKGSPQSVAIETFGTVSNLILIACRSLCVGCSVYFLVNIARFIKNHFLNGDKR